jgi:hypothetical protein
MSNLIAHLGRKEVQKKSDGVEEKFGFEFSGKEERKTSF